MDSHQNQDNAAATNVTTTVASIESSLINQHLSLST